MSHDAKHVEDEQAILERISLFYNGLPKGKWKPCKPPEPDFHSITENPLIGLELTRIYKLGEGLKLKESEQDHILSLAKDLYAGQGLPPLNVRVFWNHWFTPKKGERRQIAQQLFEKAAKNIPAIGSQITLDLCDKPLPDLPFGVPFGVDKIQLDRFGEYNFHFWNSPRAAFVPDITPEDIQAKVTTKSKRYRNYQGACNELWLLIVAEGFSPSSFGRPSKALVTHKYKGIFHNLLFASLIPTQVIELQVSNKAQDK